MSSGIIARNRNMIIPAITIEKCPLSHFKINRKGKNKEVGIDVKDSFDYERN